MSHATLTPTQLAQLLATSPTATLIDVRTPAEFAEVHAPAARNLPLPDVSVAALAALGHTDLNAPVYLLCRTGRRATAAAETLAAAGFKRPIVIAGGTLA